MGPCLSRSSTTDRDKALKRCPMYNEHSYIESFYKFGVVGQKSSDGEIHVGLRATKTTKKDREFTTVNGKKKHHQDPSIEEVPSIQDVMTDSDPGQRFEIPTTSNNNDTINIDSSNDNATR